MRENFYISFGIWIALLPFLGIPSIWKNGLFVASGILLIIISTGPILFKAVQPKSKLKSKPKLKQSRVVLENTTDIQV